MGYLESATGNPPASSRCPVWLAVALLLSMFCIGLMGCRFENPAALQATESFGRPSPTGEAVSSTGTLDDDVEPVLVSAHLGETRPVDGILEAMWEGSGPLVLPLTWGWDGDEVALRVELRSLHTDDMVCFGARWSGPPPDNEDDAALNKLTVHWRIPAWQAEDTGHLDCTVVCHTAFADAQGRTAYMNAETIPQGGDAALLSAGRWESGVWTIEWCRPLQSGNPYDLQFTALYADYPFRVKIFQRLEGRPDPVSGLAFLRFEE